MNLQVLVALAEIVSASAVVLTLVVLIISIRQNTKSQKALVVDSLAAAITSINVPAMESPALGSALSKATANWGSATREERIVAHYFLFSFFKLLENAWYQQKTGVLDKAQWLGWEKLLRKYYHSDGVRRVWLAGSSARVFARVSNIPFRNKAAGRAWQPKRIVRSRSR
jgi:hypothetical protein